MARVSPPTFVRPEPERDQYNRYVIPHPHTGEKWAWTRVTTWADSISDNFGLEKWKVRQTALGLVAREDLFVSIAAVQHPESKDGKKKINELCEAAQEHAGSSTRSNLGTALHSFAAQVDIGQSPRIPAPYSKDIAAYRAKLAEQGIEVSPNFVERIVVLPELDVAGTMDRVVKWRGKLFIGDIKTGNDLSYSWTEIAIQTALYAHAESIFDVELNKHFPMPAVDRDQALIIHLPAGKATCTPYLVDIASGWKTALLCGLVRKWRKRKDIAQTLESAIATQVAS